MNLNSACINRRKLKVFYLLWRQCFNFKVPANINFSFGGSSFFRWVNFTTSKICRPRYSSSVCLYCWKKTALLESFSNGCKTFTFSLFTALRSFLFSLFPSSFSKTLNTRAQMNHQERNTTFVPLGRITSSQILVKDSFKKFLTK